MFSQSVLANGGYGGAMAGFDLTNIAGFPLITAP